MKKAIFGEREREGREIKSMAALGAFIILIRKALLIKNLITPLDRDCITASSAGTSKPQKEGKKEKELQFRNGKCFVSVRDMTVHFLT